MFAVFKPTTSPERFKIGPPEALSFITTSVFIKDRETLSAVFSIKDIRPVASEGLSTHVIAMID